VAGVVTSSEQQLVVRFLRAWSYGRRGDRPAEQWEAVWRWFADRRVGDFDYFDFLKEVGSYLKRIGIRGMGTERIFRKADNRLRKWVKMQRQQYHFFYDASLPADLPAEQD